MRLIFLCGISGSGKTSYASILQSNIQDTIIVSSDGIRKELYGDESIQGDGKRVFTILKNRAAKALFEGFNVIIDATNTHKREALKREILNKANCNEIITELHILECEINTAMKHQESRDRKVDRGVVVQQYKQLENSLQQLSNENWDRVLYVTN